MYLHLQPHTIRLCALFLITTVSNVLVMGLCAYRHKERSLPELARNLKSQTQEGNNKKETHETKIKIVAEQTKSIHPPIVRRELQAHRCTLVTRQLAQQLHHSLRSSTSACCRNTAPEKHLCSASVTGLAGGSDKSIIGAHGHAHDLVVVAKHLIRFCRKLEKKDVSDVISWKIQRSLWSRFGLTWPKRKISKLTLQGWSSPINARHTARLLFGIKK